MAVRGTLPLTNESNYNWETVLLDNLPSNMISLLNSQFDNIKVYNDDWVELDVRAVSPIAEYNCDGFLAVKVPKEKITCPLRLILEIYEKEYHLTNNNVGKAWIANDRLNMFSSGSFKTDSTGSVLEGSDLIAINPFEFNHGSVVIRGSMTSPWSVKAASEFNSYGFNYSKKVLNSGFNDDYSKDLTLKEDWLNGSVVFTHSKEEYNSKSVYHLAYSRKATSRVIHKIASENEDLTNEYLHLNGFWKVKEVYEFNQPLSSQGEYCRLTYTVYDSGAPEKVFCKLKTSLNIRFADELKDKLLEDEKEGHFFWINWGDYPERDIRYEDGRNMRIFIDDEEIPHYTWAKSSTISLIWIPVNLIDETVNISAIIFGRQLITEVDTVFNGLIDTDAGRTPDEYISVNSDLPSKAYNGLIIGENTYYIDSYGNRIHGGWKVLDSYIHGNSSYHEINSNHNEFFLIWNNGTPLIWNSDKDSGDGLGFSTNGKLIYKRHKLSDKTYTTTKTGTIATRFLIQEDFDSIRVVNDLLGNNPDDDTFEPIEIDSGNYFTFNNSDIFSYFSYENDYFRISGEDPIQGEVFGTGVCDVSMLLADKEVIAIYKGEHLLFDKSNFDAISVDRTLWDHLSEVDSNE